MATTALEIHELGDVMAKHAAAGQLWLEFLRVPELSMGLYVLPAGGTDPQNPHNEDEVYYVLEGRAQITVEGETLAVQPGSIVFVAKHAAHKFHDIAEELKLLVFFAPAHT